MPAIAYNLNIPDAPNNPSVDQPNMKINTNASNTWMDRDHYTFSNTDAGLHRFITFPLAQLPAAVIDPVSVAFTAPGIANPNVELFYKNASAILPVSCIKAFGTFTTVLAAPPTATNLYNCTVAFVSPAVYNITLSPATCVTGTDFIVIVNTSTGLPVNYTYTSPVITVNISPFLLGIRINFIVLQA